MRETFESRFSHPAAGPASFVTILIDRITPLDEAAHDSGVVRISAPGDPAGIGDSVVELHHELRRYLAMGQILVLTPNAEDLQCILQLLIAKVVSLFKYDKL